MTPSALQDPFESPARSSCPAPRTRPPLRSDPDRWTGNDEPSIAELLNDPLADLILRRDGIDRRHVIAAMRMARQGTGAGEPRPQTGKPLPPPPSGGALAGAQPPALPCMA